MTDEKPATVRALELLRLGDLDGAHRIAEDVIGRVADQGDAVDLWRARFIRTEIMSIRGHSEEALQYLDSLIAPEAANHEASVGFKLNRGRFLGALGKRSEACECLAQAESMAREAHLPELLGEVYLSQGFIYFLGEKYDSSDRAFRLALGISAEVGGWHLRGHALWGIGKNLMIQGCYGEAMAWLQESLTIFNGVEAKLARATVWGELAVCHLGLGDDQTALELNLRAAAVEYKAGFIHNYQVSLANVGNVYLHRRDYFTALSYYHRAVTLAREIRDPVSVRKWTYNINLTYARIRAQVDHDYPLPVA